MNPCATVISSGNSTNALLSILCCRDAVSDLALHFLNKMKILVVRDIERDEIEFICKVV